QRRPAHPRLLQPDGDVLGQRGGGDQQQTGEDERERSAHRGHSSSKTRMSCTTSSTGVPKGAITRRRPAGSIRNTDAEWCSRYIGGRVPGKSPRTTETP